MLGPAADAGIVEGAHEPGVALSGSVGEAQVLEREEGDRIVEPIGHGLELISCGGVGSDHGGGVEDDFLPLMHERERPLRERS